MSEEETAGEVEKLCAEAAALSAAASAGPWRTDPMNAVAGSYLYGPQRPEAREAVPEGFYRAIPPIVMVYEDAEFCARARDLLPALAENYDKLKHKVRDLEAQLKEASDSLLMLAITGTNELPKLSWDDLETEVPTTAEDLRGVIEKRKAEAMTAWRKINNPRPAGMTERDHARWLRALDCDRKDPEAVADAVRGLQSTDHPSLVPLHDELMAVLKKLEAAAASPPEE